MIKIIEMTSTFGELLESEIEAQQLLGANFRSCDAFKYFDTIDKNLTVDEALTFFESESLKNNSQIPFWFFIATVHLNGRVTPDVYERFKFIINLDKTGRVARVSEKFKLGRGL